MKTTKNSASSDRQKAAVCPMASTTYVSRKMFRETLPKLTPADVADVAKVLANPAYRLPVTTFIDPTLIFSREMVEHMTDADMDTLTRFTDFDALIKALDEDGDSL